MTDSQSVTVISRDGDTQSNIEWVRPQSLMEAIRDNDLPISAECGGFASCATCHVHLDAASYRAFAEPADDEIEMLEGEERYTPGTSRLACQLPFTVTDGVVAAQLASPPVDF